MCQLTRGLKKTHEGQVVLTQPDVDDIVDRVKVIKGRLAKGEEVCIGREGVEQACIGREGGEQVCDGREGVEQVCIVGSEGSRCVLGGMGGREWSRWVLGRWVGIGRERFTL